MAKRARVWGLITAAVFLTSGCWAQIHGDAAHSGYQPFETVMSVDNVASLSRSWSAATSFSQSSSPVVANGVVYVGGYNGTLYAFAALGCTPAGAPCEPLWTGSTGSSIFGAPAVAAGVVYVVDWVGTVAAFDANGTINCGGTPTVCKPLWTASIATRGQIGANASPTVAGGRLFINGISSGLTVFDAGGQQGCGGTPRVCTPLWTATTRFGGSSSSPAVVAGTVYVALGDGLLSAFDVAGGADCVGTPTVCRPRWVSSGFGYYGSTPSVVAGRVYIGSLRGTVDAYDISDLNACTGTPLTCDPVRSFSLDVGTGATPAIANGVLYIGADDGQLRAFDASGTTNCDAAGRVCASLWSAAVGNFGGSGPAVANGVVYVTASNTAYFDGIEGLVYGFDAAGVRGCSGTPRTCVAIWAAETPGQISASPAVAGGTLYVASSTGLISAYRPCGNPLPNAGLRPCDIQNAYRLPSDAAGSGRTIAIVDAFHNPNAESDLAVYRATFGLPPCTSANGCFRQVNSAGGTSAFPRPDSQRSDIGWAIQTSTDLDLAAAVCPQCKLLLVEAPNTRSGLGAAEDTAAKLGANVVSNGFGLAETTSTLSGGSHYNHPGIPIVAAAGNTGYTTSGLWPAAIPSVVAVGGTTLTKSTSPRGWTEAAWNDAPALAGASFCSPAQPKGAWQNDPLCTRRTGVDVSAVARGLAVYDTWGIQQPGWITVGGSGAATPIIAGVLALGGSTRGNADLYAAPWGFFDITKGSNGVCGGTYLCAAGSGFDAPTGLGTPCGVGAFVKRPTVPDALCGAGVTSDGTPVEPAPHTDYLPACANSSASGISCQTTWRIPTSATR